MGIDLENVLEKRLQHVNYWLEFAEKKIAVLIVLNGGAIWGISRLIDISELKNLSVSHLLWGGVVLILISIFCCCASLLPALKKVSYSADQSPSDEDNSLFFGDIAKYDTHEYLALLLRRYSFDSSELKQLHREYAGQIITNARIAKRKYQMFAMSSWFAVIGFLLLTIFSVIFISKVYL